MSDETQANPLFAPFVPPAAGAPMPFTEAPSVPVKRGRKPRTPKAIKAAPKQPRQKRKQKRKPKPPRQPVAPEQVARSKDTIHNMNLQTMLRACAGLKEEDFAAFDALFKLPAVQRERVLAAIGKVFA